MPSNHLKETTPVNLSYIKGNTNYELANHTSVMLSTGIGNVLAIVSDRLFSTETYSGSGIVEHYSADIVSSSDYYPGVYTERSRSGMQMPGRTFSSNQYRYGFNGKEKDPEGMGGGGTTYDYGFRIYNAQIAKFLSVDPLTSSYPWYTPYQFAGNKPIWAIDLDGLEELIYLYYIHDNRDAKLFASAYIPEEHRILGKDGILTIGIDDISKKIIYQYQYTKQDGSLVTEVMEIDFIKTDKKKQSGFWSSVGNFFRNLLPSDGTLQGDGGWQAGGVTFYSKDGGGISPSKYKSKNPSDGMVETDLLMAATGGVGAGGKPSTGIDAIIDLVNTGAELFNVTKPHYEEFMNEIKATKEKEMEAYDNEMIELKLSDKNGSSSKGGSLGPSTSTYHVQRKDSSLTVNQHNEKLKKPKS